MMRTLLLLGVLGFVQPAHALFHAAKIDEAYLGNGADLTGQFLEIRMLFPAQTFVTNSRISTFSCDGTVVTDLLVLPNDIAHGGTDVRWLMATDGDTPFSTLFGVHAEFYVAGHFPVPCGQICWGAPPTAGFLPPANPTSWDHAVPSNFVDCIAYGNYTGPTKSDALPTTGTLVGAQSYQRSASDFAPACPTPTDNNGNMGGIGGCTPPPSTTTTTSTSVTSTTHTTSTTVLALTGQALTGKQLTLKVKTGKPQKSHATAVSADTSLALGGGNGSIDDPTLHGGSLRLAGSADGALFDTVYDLPMTGWKYVGKSGKNKGYHWNGKVAQGPGAAVLVKAGHTLKVSIQGSGLDLNLASDPNPVIATLAIGNRRYCLRFGGTTKFKANASFTAKSAPAPSGCP